MALLHWGLQLPLLPRSHFLFAPILIHLSISRVHARSYIAQALDLMNLGVMAVACSDSSNREAGGSRSLLVGKESTWCKWASESSCQSRAKNTISASGACSPKGVKALSPRCFHVYDPLKICFSGAKNTLLLAQAFAHGIRCHFLFPCFLDVQRYI